MSPAATEFERHRARLRGLAYRMLGSLSDADDVVQDAFLRWHGVAGETGAAIRRPGAWLTTAVTRLCIDRLRAAATERAAYVGPWLPEPWIGDVERPDSRLEREADLSLAFVALLERLSPEERAAFLLHDMFETGYAEIAEILGKSEAACRQMVHRARERLRDHKVRFRVSAEEQRRLVDQFIAATMAGDADRLLSLLAPGAAFVSDGGGKVPAALNVITGADRIVRLTLGIARKFAGRIEHRAATVNGEPGFLSYRDGSLWSATSLVVDRAGIQGIYRVLNPDKLGSVPPLAGAAAPVELQAASPS